MIRNLWPKNHRSRPRRTLFPNLISIYSSVVGSFSLLGTLYQQPPNQRITITKQTSCSLKRPAGASTISIWLDFKWGFTSCRWVFVWGDPERLFRFGWGYKRNEIPIRFLLMVAWLGTARNAKTQIYITQSGLDTLNGSNIRFKIQFYQSVLTFNKDIQLFGISTIEYLLCNVTPN